MKKVFLKISQKSRENICARVSFLTKERLWHRCFPVRFAKFLRTPFLQNISGRLIVNETRELDLYALKSFCFEVH